MKQVFRQSFGKFLWREAYAPDVTFDKVTLVAKNSSWAIRVMTMVSVYLPIFKRTSANCTPVALKGNKLIEKFIREASSFVALILELFLPFILVSPKLCVQGLSVPRGVFALCALRLNLWFRVVFFSLGFGRRLGGMPPRRFPVLFNVVVSVCLNLLEVCRPFFRCVVSFLFPSHRGCPSSRLRDITYNNSFMESQVP